MPRTPKVDPVPVEKITVSLPPELARKLRMHVAADKLKPSDIIAEALERFFDQLAESD